MSNRISIGIHAHEQPEQLIATLESVRRNTSVPVDLILLPDGPDARMSDALLRLGHLPQFGTEDPRGPAACFNRLAANTTSEIVILLESGSQVGAGWLDDLVAGLESDPRNGLAGPTTNYAWNEQCVYAGGGGSPEEIDRTAQAAALRFGREVRTLEPLYSLSDFCYAVRRAVIEAVGAADERYGLGPCWEMDYNIRAARAGWRGVWVCAAYVYRAPFTTRRRLEEQSRFEASKHRYQDKFCGARLRGEKTDYRPHCRGDACRNFAPAGQIEIQRPFADSPPAVRCGTSIADESALHTNDPLVSCIMPTCNRRRLVPQAIRCFFRQEYPNLELIVVDDGEDSVADLIPHDARVRYLRLDHKLTIGAKRNLACQHALGDFIVHWDDDDWYAASRIRTQMEALHAGSAEICGSSRMYFYAPAAQQAWEYRYAPAEPAWVGGTTLAFRKETWKSSPFPDLQVGEDCHFVCYSGRKAIVDLAAPELFVGMVHAGNTSYKETSGCFWRPIASDNVRRLLGADEHAYHALLGSSDAAARWPLISCIMPTHGRRAFAPLALRCFLDQDYPNKELIVVDDGDDRIDDLTRDVPGVRYLAPAWRMSIGAKRNLACREAKGSIIAHWDDDDWYAPDRLRYQAMPILAGEADITGLENAFVLELSRGEFWRTGAELHRRMFVGDVHGGTLVYRKEILAGGVSYPEVNLAEDAWLLRQALARGKTLRRLDNPGVFVYVRHGFNAWKEAVPGRFLDPAGWSRTPPPANLPASVLEKWAVFCRGGL